MGRARGALAGKRTLEEFSGDPRPALAYAEHLLRHGRGEIVPGMLADIPPDNPFAALAQWRLALALASREDFPGAAGAARRAAALACPTTAAIRTPAVFLRLAALHDSVGGGPQDAGLRVRYGRALGDFGLFALAYPQFHAARALPGTGAEPDYWLARYLDRQGRPQHAVPTLQRALGIDPGYLPARLALADALLELGRRHEAREQLELVQDRIGPDGPRWYNLACLRATESATDAALDALERAIAAGYDDRAGIVADRDLDALRGQPRFQRLLDRLSR